MPLPKPDLDHVLSNVDFGELKGSRLLITGGTGFVGKWLLESLLWANDELGLGVSVVVLTRDPDRFVLTFPHLATHRSVQLLGGLVQHFPFPAGGEWFVIHAATQPYFEPAPERPLSTFDLDVAGTRHVLDFARSQQMRGLLLTSSGAVYGKQPSGMSHIPESYLGAPESTDAGTVYGQSKRVSEWMSVMYSRQYDFPVKIARLFAFCGPYLPMDHNYAVGNFLGDILSRRPIEIKGDGTPYRSYLYAADMAVWLWTILLRGESGRPYNVGSDRAVSIAELARTIAEVTGEGNPIKIMREPVPGVPAFRYVPSVDRAEKELALRQMIMLEEGVRRTYGWARKEQTV